MKRTILKADGTKGKAEVGNDFREWNRAIGAQIGELVVCPGGAFELWCDEEGLWNQPELNLIASMMSGRKIVGDVIVMLAGDVK